MSQSKKHSMLETSTNTAVGFFGSYLITIMCISHVQLGTASLTLLITVLCTVWSLVRGYFLRRFFNHLHTRKTPLLCNHLYVDGFGGMGDAVVCCKCGVDKYPEAAPGYWLARVQGRVIKEDHPEYKSYATQARQARTRRNS